MPLSDDPFSRGKCGFKLLQYIACGVPAVASPVGVNTDICDGGRTGILAATPADWAPALARIAATHALVRVEARWSSRVLGPPFAQALAACGRA